MKRAALLVFVILTYLRLSYSVCPDEWFGLNCQYKCRCTENKCAPLTGTCIDGARCQHGWFGPACQYVDLAQSYVDLAQSYAVFKNRSRVSLAIDQNDTTCMLANKMTLSLAVPLQLSWFRAHVMNSHYLDKLNIQFQEEINSSLLACDNKRTALVSDTAVDIHCDLDVKVTQVILTGESVPALCSFYISGGRNVALRQHTAQSSDYDVRHTPASNGVDGDTSKMSAKGTCTHTDFGDSVPTWNVTFDKPRAVNRYVIHNIDAGAHVVNRLSGFHLTSYDSAGAEVFHFIDRTPTEQTVYTVTSLTKEVQVVSINVHKVDATIKYPILSLCEVEVYGDNVCEPGLYGRDCEHKCNCADSNTCFVSTGGCPSGCSPGFQWESCTEVCQKGWFGASCQYKCHCVRDLCSPADGSCTQRVSCTSGWFGPGCQYEDLVQTVTLGDQTLLPPALRDSNDYSCIDDPTQKVIIAWTTPYEFTWLRAVLKDPDFLSALSLQFKTDTGSQSMNCTNQRQAKVGNRAMDIHCDLSKAVKQVIVTGEGVKYLCSLYISGGRNVALKQKTKQATTYLQILQAPSRRVVDGNRDGILPIGDCTRLDYHDHTSTWTVFLSRKLLVNRYVLHVRNQVILSSSKLHGFLLESFSEEGIKVFQYTGFVPAYRTVLTITTPPASPISRVNIQVANVSAYQTDNFLTLCEVEIFGDTVCEPGQYGRQCEHKCACRNGLCFVSTGGCPSGCAPGFRGESCDQVCRHGAHGPDCGISCSQFCRADDLSTTACDHVHGACLHGCKPGYSGSMCYEECENGHFGQDCNATCPRLCLAKLTNEQRVCHHVNGTCLQGCQAGYMGPLCHEKCDRATFGQDCNSTCPQDCENLNTSLSVCHHISGTCSQGCLPGYKGVRCDESKTHASRKEDSSPGYSTTPWAVSGCIIVAVLVVVGLIVLWRFKKLKSYTIWTFSCKNLQKSDQSEMILTTETSAVDESEFHEQHVA